MSGSHEAMSEKALVSFSYVNVASRVMSEGVGACILSWGELCCTVRDVSNLDYFLGQIRADIHSNCLTNGPNAFSFSQSSQVLKEVLLPFFEKKYSEHLLFCTFHGEEDGSCILAGQQCSKSYLYREDCLHVLILCDGIGQWAANVSRS